jgi:hypothetical protein
MGHVITLCVDLAKSVFQVHGVDAEGAGRLYLRSILQRRYDG